MRGARERSRGRAEQGGAQDLEFSVRLTVQKTLYCHGLSEFILISLAYINMSEMYNVRMCCHREAQRFLDRVDREISRCEFYLVPWQRGQNSLPMVSVINVSIGQEAQELNAQRARRSRRESNMQEYNSLNARGERIHRQFESCDTILKHFISDICHDS